MPHHAPKCDASSPNNEPVAKPLTSDERHTITELIQAGEPLRRIAQPTGRSRGTITGIAKTLGHTFGQSQAREAREARSAYCAEARANAARLAQERLEELLVSFVDERPVVVNSKDGPEVVMTRPDARAIRDLASAVHTLQRTGLDIDRHDNRNDEGAAAGEQWLRDITGGVS